MELGLVGRANAGKTALFNLVTGAAGEVAPYPYTTREPARAMADVPDERVAAIADAQDIPRRVLAQVQLVDIAGLAAGAGGGEGLGGAALGQLRQADALVHVVRAFANAEVPHPEEAVDPLADAEAVDLELIVADREQVERRLERVRKAARAGEADAKEEQAQLEAVAALLDAGEPARAVADEEARERAFEMGLLSAKPVLYVANTDEELEPPADLAAYAAERGARCLALPVGLELELAAMDPAEAAELAEEMGLGQVRGADAVVAGAYELLDLVTFFTGSGPPEARAWPITRGTNAQRAAGKIHSDLERGFIRAEVINWQDLVNAGAWAKAKEQALVRMEGKEYIVQEGDVLQIRFNV
ncbi:MAG TPA: redox-regulated ATPase YchF [Miltoncostaeaceae bacterium]|nr:redox-regulated ATPase YchF [Miltoncostaeaceae bacterium]